MALVSWAVTTIQSRHVSRKSARDCHPGIGGVMKCVVTLLLLVAYAAPTFGGQSSERLYGVVRDQQGLPIDGAIVTMSGSTGVETLTTASDGAYQFSVIPGRGYTLTATKTGFKNVVKEIPVDGRESPPVDLNMEPLSYLETVIVTASRSPESLLTTPASVAVLTDREIAASGADNFAGLLQQVPGLNITQLSARDIEINARGSTGILSNSMLVLVDGRSFVQPFYGAVYWDLMTTTKDEIAQIEVLRTPASALWGANALNGVVNILTKSPRQM